MSTLPKTATPRELIGLQQHKRNLIHLVTMYERIALETGKTTYYQQLIYNAQVQISDINKILKTYNIK